MYNVDDSSSSIITFWILTICKCHPLSCLCDDFTQKCFFGLHGFNILSIVDTSNMSKENLVTKRNAKSVISHCNSYILKHYFGYFEYYLIALEVHSLPQGLKLRKYFRGQVGPHQINFGSPHNLLGAHHAHSSPATSLARCPTAGGPLKAPGSPGINGVKSCILAIQKLYFNTEVNKFPKHFPQNKMILHAPIHYDFRNL